VVKCLEGKGKFGNEPCTGCNGKKKEETRKRAEEKGQKD
jgi:hypothetical protein